ncbi:Clusterin-associated protein-1-domain-containing protein [Tribonema minus]|uniref:Clusterin-associated protein-1-domain-containing protein n=1 Tax=Tribonema minus TaxID=303371 RepID=A0A836CCE3_9STRA|nr:Clusterin-associated protein-1-domain-containing protein [Tribonema minus]
MSFRELRNFTEMMRALGYPRLISVDNFRTPNFELVADILYWLVKRYDPDVPISDNIESEGDRVDFLLGAAQAMAAKAHIRMNARKLYSADGHAVKELLKLATVLYRASRAEEDAAAEGEDASDPAPLASQGGVVTADAGDTAAEPAALVLGSVKEARALAADITERGARLHDLLGREPAARRARLRAAAFLEAATAAGGSGGGGGAAAAEMGHVEGSLREIVARARENLAALQRQTADLEADERALDARIKKAQYVSADPEAARRAAHARMEVTDDNVAVHEAGDLERNEKRLRSLETHRPAFADELEKLEAELQRYYEVYMVRFRNLDYLEHELERYAEAERAEMEEHNRRRNRNAEKCAEMEEHNRRRNRNAEKAEHGEVEEHSCRRNQNAEKAEHGEVEEHNRRRNRNAEVAFGSAEKCGALSFGTWSATVRKEQLKQFIGREASEAAVQEELQRSKPNGSAQEDAPGRAPSAGATDRRDQRSRAANGGGAGGGGGGGGGAARPAARRHSSSAASSGSDINSSRSATEDEISLNDSSEGSSSLINDDDESSEADHTGSASGSDDENF